MTLVSTYRKVISDLIVHGINHNLPDSFEDNIDNTWYILSHSLYT